MSDMADLYQFDIVDGTVTAGYVYERGIWQFIELEANESFAVDDADVVRLKTEDDGQVEVEDRYTDSDQDGVYVELDEDEPTLGSGGDGPDDDGEDDGPDSEDDGDGNDPDQYRFVVVDGVVTQVFEYEDGNWQQKSLDADETFLVDGDSIVKIETKSDGGSELHRYIDPDQDGIYIEEEAIALDLNMVYTTMVDIRNERWGDDSSDNFKGKESDDKFFGARGSDKMFGEAGEDNLTGGDDSDLLDGGDDDDFLNGGSGKDKLRGGDDDDSIIGGEDADQASGGLGADDFVYTSELDSGVGKKLRDRIVDYNSSQGDRLNLGAIDANHLVDGNQAFEYIEQEEFHNVAGELRFAKGILQADFDGDGRADFEIQFKGVSSLDTSLIVF